MRGGCGWRWSCSSDDALDALITGESRFAELPAVLARLSRGPGAALCHRISYLPD